MTAFSSYARIVARLKFDDSPSSDPLLSRRHYKMQPRVCQWCGDTYTPTGSQQKRCEPCREIYHHYKYDKAKCLELVRSRRT